MKGRGRREEEEGGAGVGVGFENENGEGGGIRLSTPAVIIDDMVDDGWPTLVRSNPSIYLP